MYAVIANGGKQYKVAEGQFIRLEKFEAEAGSKVVFDQVLMVSDGDNVQIGAPLLDKMTVTAEVVGLGREKKIEIIKFKRRKHHMKRMGHRQDYTEVKITAIGDGAKKKAAVKKAEESAEKAEQPAKAAAKKAEPKKPAAKAEAKPKQATATKTDAKKTAEKKPAAATKAKAKPAAKDKPAKEE